MHETKNYQVHISILLFKVIWCDVEMAILAKKAGGELGHEGFSFSKRWSPE